MAPNIGGAAVAPQSEPCINCGHRLPPSPKSAENPFHIDTDSRLHRLNATKKEVVIYDNVGFEVPLLAKMYSRRRARYKAIGYEIAVREAASGGSQLALANL